MLIRDVLHVFLLDEARIGKVLLEVAVMVVARHNRDLFLEQRKPKTPCRFA